MPQSEHSITQLNKLLSNDAIPSLSKLIEIDFFLKYVPYVSDVDKLVEDLPFDQYKHDPELTMLLKLSLLHLLIYHGTTLNPTRVEEELKAVNVNNLDPSISGVNAFCLKLKFNDLLSDYNYLFAPTADEHNLIDLVNKKLLLINNVVSDDVRLTQLLNIVHLKILVLTLLSGSDFRKPKILQHLKDLNLDFSYVGNSVKTYLDLSMSNKFTPSSVFEDFLQDVKAKFPVFTKLSVCYQQQIIEDYLDNNFSKLPHYYETVYILNLSKMFIDVHETTVEDIIHKMIVQNRLPQGSAIDQRKGLVLLGSPFHSEYDGLNSHIKSVGDTINEITKSIV